MAKNQETFVETPFYDYLWDFYINHKKEIRREYTDLTKKILSQASPENSDSFLRKPQYEAFEMYVFLKEYLCNPLLADLFEDWRNDSGKFRMKDTNVNGIAGNLFYSLDAANFEPAIQQLRNLQQDYANYIFSLTMGTGKTILMALCIFYEFLLANKYPEDKRFCHNALVLAPDTTVLQSLKEIQTFDKSKIFKEQYANQLNSIIHFHFLEEDGIALSTADGSDFNLIISTSQKIILHKKHTKDSAADSLFLDGWDEAVKDDPNADLYQLDDETDLMANQRYTKLTRLKQLGIYVDEAHHAFGKSLKNDMVDRTKETSLRLTIDNLAKELKNAGTSVVACYNFTGTPYIENHLMPEVVYDYGLNEAIKSGYLKQVDVQDYQNVQTDTFVKTTINEFIKAQTNEDGSFKRYEGMLPKMAFFASTIDELTQELQPAVEAALTESGISLDSILVNVGDDKITKQDDLREFLLLDTIQSQKQFILLVGKGKEGWNCRSLFSVALFRKPKSTIFVLQATMRCLRAISDIQQTGQVFLSTENLAILQNELEQNFRMKVEDLSDNKKNEKPVKKIYVRHKVPVKVMEKIPEFKIKELSPGTFTIFDEDFNFEHYKKTVGHHSLTNIDSATIRSEVKSDDERTFTEYSLIAELSIFLTQHEKDKDDESKNIVRFSPVEIKKILENTTEGITGILEKVNYANDILYDWVVPKIFSKLYEVKYEEGEPREITKYIVKEPPEDNNGEKYYSMRFDDDMFISDSAPRYSIYNQSEKGNKKSFDLSGYGFDSGSEKQFFDRNLFNNENIKHIWFTGMLTNGQGDFFVRYIDPETHALRSYYPDFLIETKTGDFFIVEIKGENLIDHPDTKAKVAYARQMFSMQNKMEYVFIPSKYADMILEEFIKQSSYLASSGLYDKKQNNYWDNRAVADSAPKYSK